MNDLDLTQRATTKLPYLVVYFFRSRGQFYHLLMESALLLVQLHTLAPVVEGTRHEDLIRGVVPTQRFSPISLQSSLIIAKVSHCSH